MTLDQLRAFVAVVEEQGFHGASERLHKSRSTISTAVKNLEDELSLPLFSRDEYRVRLTQAGKSFYDKSVSLLKNAENLELMGRYLGQGQEPEINIAINSLCPLVSATTMLQFCKGENPQTRFKVVVEHGQSTLNSVLSGHSDMAITYLPSNIQDLQVSHWTNVTMEPLAHTSLDLGNEESQVRETLESYPQILVGTADTTLAVDSLVPILKGGEQWVVSDYFLSRSLVLGAVGWGYLPTHLCTRDLDNGSLTMIKAKNLKPIHIQLYLIRRLDRTVGPVAGNIWNYLV